ncbi:MAG: hypothetical protein PWQ77_1844 [Kosmotogales bacterium]|nr:hypothetical protein [Kosmotogales bacterium]
MREITVVDYDPNWENEFNKLKEVYLIALKDLNVDIQHVGSTAVKRLAAKPIIDIDIIVDGENEKEKIIRILETLGYRHMGDLGIRGREVFKADDESVPHNEKYKNFMEHHLYLIEKGNVNLNNHLKLRDFLRSNSLAVNEYGDLKKKLAEEYKYDIDSYIEKKTALITGFLEKMGMTESELKLITEENENKD